MCWLEKMVWEADYNIDVVPLEKIIVAVLFG